MTGKDALGGGKSIHYYCDGRIYTGRQFFTKVVGPVYAQLISGLSTFIEMKNNMTRTAFAIKSKGITVERTIPDTIEAATLLLNNESVPFGLEDILGFTLKGYAPWGV